MGALRLSESDVAPQCPARIRKFAVALARRQREDSPAPPTTAGCHGLRDQSISKRFSLR